MNTILFLFLVSEREKKYLDGKFISGDGIVIDGQEHI